MSYEEEIRDIVVTGRCDFCDGHMDNCPYCRTARRHYHLMTPATPEPERGIRPRSVETAGGKEYEIGRDCVLCGRPATIRDACRSCAEELYG